MINEEYNPRSKVAVATGVAGPRGIRYASAKRMVFLFALLALLPIMGLSHLLSISMPLEETTSMSRVSKEYPTENGDFRRTFHMVFGDLVGALKMAEVT